MLLINTTIIYNCFCRRVTLPQQWPITLPASVFPLKNPGSRFLFSNDDLEAEARRGIITEQGFEDNFSDDTDESDFDPWQYDDVDAADDDDDDDDDDDVLEVLDVSPDLGSMSDGSDDQASGDLRELADVSTMNMQLTAAAAAAESTQHVSDAAIAASLSPSMLLFSSACSTFLDQARQSSNAVEPPPRSRDLRSPSSVSESEVDWIDAPSAATARSPVQVDRYGDGTLTTMRAEEQQDDLKRSVGETMCTTMTHEAEKEKAKQLKSKRELIKRSVAAALEARASKASGLNRDLRSQIVEAEAEQRVSFIYLFHLSYD